jgi:hypothetical protein
MRRPVPLACRDTGRPVVGMAGFELRKRAIRRSPRDAALTASSQVRRPIEVGPSPAVADGIRQLPRFL